MRAAETTRPRERTLLTKPSPLTPPTTRIRVLSTSQSQKVIAADGIQPAAETIASASYPYSAPVWVIVRTDLDRFSYAYQLRDWLLDPDGQEVVSRSGYVPLSRNRGRNMP